MRATLRPGSEYDISPRRKRNATLNAWIDSISISALRLHRGLASYSEPALILQNGCVILRVSAQPQLSSLQTDARVLLWFYHTVQAAMLLCKHTAGGVTALNEIHTTHLHH